jgi:FixJ family two-component response regulator
MSDFTIFIVDDDKSILRSLARLLRAADFKVVTFTSGQEYLDRHDPDQPGCLISDLSMPGIDGLQLQSALSAAGELRPIIFLTGRGNIPSTVQAIQHGAVDFLTKPFNDVDLLAAIERAKVRDMQVRREQQQSAIINANLKRLTPRERQVLAHVIAGRLNKQIAWTFGTKEKTIKVHRSRVMGKMKVRNVADLVRAAQCAGVAPYEGDDGEYSVIRAPPIAPQS